MIVKKILTGSLKVILSKTIRVLLIIIVTHPLSAGLDDMPVGARSLGMGSTYVGIANTAEAIFLNQGGLSQLSGTEISLFYQKPFGLADINFGTISASFPLAGFRFGLGLSTLGNKIYKEQMFTAAFSHHYKQKVFYGIGIRYKTLKISNYGSTGIVGLDFGLLVPITNELKWGFQTQNINRSKIGKSDESTPQIFKTGFSVEPNPKLILAFELFKDIRFPEELRFGAEFNLIQNLALRAGISTNPDRFSTGFGINVNLFTIDYAFFTHTDLGLTHQVSLSIHLNKRQEKPPEVMAIFEVARKDDPNLLILNLNIATVEELKTLEGIGEKLAGAIVEYRNEKGPFRKIEDLLNVPGIGSKKFDKIKERIYVEQVAEK